MSNVDIFAPRSGNTGVSRIDGKNVIEPGAQGKYVLRVKNPESYDLLYSISLSAQDSNTPKLPMKFRISSGTNGTDYIGGSDWKSAADIKASNYTLAAGDSDYYTIYWNWISLSDSQDTAIGMQTDNPSYILNIIIKVQQK